MIKTLSSVAVSPATPQYRFRRYLSNAITFATAQLRSKARRKNAIPVQVEHHDFEGAELVHGSPRHPEQHRQEAETMMEDRLKNALSLFLSKKYRAAELEFRKILSLSPEMAHIYSLLALCLAEQGRTKEALRQANEGVRRAPDNHYAHCVVSSIYFMLGDLKKATDAISEAIRLNSRDPSYFAQAAGVCLADRKWNEAIGLAAQGLLLDPKHISCINTRATALANLGHLQDAEEGLTIALYLKPEDAETQANLGWLALSRNQPLQALDHFSESLKIDPDNRWASEGVLQALKAHHALVHPLMAPCLWLSHGSWRRASRLGWMPLLFPAPFLVEMIIYAADQMFKLLLRFDSLGRTIITKRERESNNRFIAVSILALALTINASYKDLSQCFHINAKSGLTAAHHIVRPRSMQDAVRHKS